jgi:hypothetical protein
MGAAKHKENAMIREGAQHEITPRYEQWWVERKRASGEQMVQIPVAFIDAMSGIGSAASALYIVLCYYADEGHACPSVATLAETMGCTTRTVRKARKALEDGGWITRVMRFDPAGGHRTNRYTLHESPR